MMAALSVSKRGSYPLILLCIIIFLFSKQCESTGDLTQSSLQSLDTTDPYSQSLDTTDPSLEALDTTDPSLQSLDTAQSSTDTALHRDVDEANSDKAYNWDNIRLLVKDYINLRVDDYMKGMDKDDLRLRLKDYVQRVEIPRKITPSLLVGIILSIVIALAIEYVIISKLNPWKKKWLKQEFEEEVLTQKFYENLDWSNPSVPRDETLLSSRRIMRQLLFEIYNVERNPAVDIEEVKDQHKDECKKSLKAVVKRAHLLAAKTGGEGAKLGAKLNTVMSSILPNVVGGDRTLLNFARTEIERLLDEATRVTGKPFNAFNAQIAELGDIETPQFDYTGLKSLIEEIREIPVESQSEIQKAMLTVYSIILPRYLHIHNRALAHRGIMSQAFEDLGGKLP